MAQWRKIIVSGSNAELNQISASGNIVPVSNNTQTLGTATKPFGDLFLGSGGVINLNNGDVTLTHSSNALTLAGGNLVTTNMVGNTITIAAETSLLTDTNPRLGQNLDGNQKEIINTSDIKSTIYGVDIRNIADVEPYLKLDLGLAFPTTFDSALDYLIDQLVIDYDDGTKTFTGSSRPTADMGILPVA